MSFRAEPLPVLILSGNLGAGKTTFLNALRRRSPVLKRLQADGALLLIVNDFAAENVDAVLVMKDAGEETMPVDVIPISGGCVCCNKLPALVDALLSAVAEGQHWAYVIVECTGLADTAPVVSTLLTHPYLSDLVVVDAVVTVVDVATYELLTDPLQGAQLLGTNVVLLNKMDLLSPAPRESDAARLERCNKEVWVQATRNPDVVVLAAHHGNVLTTTPDEEMLVGRYLFDQQPASRAFFTSVAESFIGRTNAEREHEEALERERLGVRSMCYRLWEVAPHTTNPADFHPPLVERREGDAVDILLPSSVSTTMRLSVVLSNVPKIIKGGLRGRRHPAVVWRSKGFFRCLDDVVDGTPRQQQFSWSSQGKAFDYAPIHPPNVHLPLNSTAIAPSSSWSVPGTACCVAELVLIGTINPEATTQTLNALFECGGS